MYTRGYFGKPNALLNVEWDEAGLKGVRDVTLICSDEEADKMRNICSGYAVDKFPVYTITGQRFKRDRRQYGPVKIYLRTTNVARCLSPRMFQVKDLEKCLVIVRFRIKRYTFTDPSEHKKITGIHFYITNIDLDEPVGDFVGV